MKKILELISKVSKIWSIIFFLTCLLILATFASSSVFSIFQKSQGDKAYQNKDYALALKKYGTAKRFWLAERITPKLKYDSLELKTKKAEIMVKSNQDYLDGIKEYNSGNFDSAKNYLLKVVENDPNYNEAKDKISIIEEKEKVIARANEETQKKTQITPPKAQLSPSASTSTKGGYDFDTYYPIILSMSDDRGNFTKQSSYNHYYYGQVSKSVNDYVKIGDTLHFKVEASDPKGREILYSFLGGPFTPNNEFTYTFTEEVIKTKSLYITVEIKSIKEYYRHVTAQLDDHIGMWYQRVEPE